MNYDYDFFVIGGGSGGIASARRAAEYGAKVAVAENDRLGGTCVNRGCIPKKLMVYASHFPHLMEDAQGYGWSAVESQLNWQKMVVAVNQEVDRLNGVYGRMLDNSKVELFRGLARFVDDRTVEIGDRRVTADKILIAVGGKPVKPDIPGIESALTSDEMFALPEQPKRMVILGAGYIGCEFACIMNGLGTEVVQVLRGDRILRGFDDDLRETIQNGMQESGIRILTQTEIKRIEETGNGIKVVLEGETEEVLTDVVSLAATGRKPNLEKLGIEQTKVEVKDGAIVVDEHNRTNVENIYAVGDCIGRIELTPVAIKEGRILADKLYGSKDGLMSYDAVPTAIFTTPEAATVGMTETQARKEFGDAVKVYRAKFRPMYYTLAGRDEKTMMKLVVDTASDRVLGAHMVGDHAAEIIQGVAIAVKMGATKADFDATVAIHPSVAEEFVTMR
ncbi:glutathione-disulfide reductase [Oscillatoria sp. FACHB-1406]|uniref:glutathione-disulfide reductase n=1 Tax=Oscillatoria sp. FACHB-1406 TaxID=2692846 RepID=UPI00168242E2|nr:glutathione-disulfide reductase [Oscillatoria sp. FACHB-1406]MBD2580512.1 glutathione-disulfide reductase [Oscillatoria sp. FACHB-1406]